MPLLLTESDVRAMLPMDDLIAAMRGALVEFSAGRVQQPLRPVVQAGGPASLFAVMPAYMADPPALGAKLVTLFEGNAAIPLPTHLATIVLLDPSTGALRAIADGRYITEARTAAVSAVATDLLARADADVLAIIGSGVQACSHLDAISRVRPLREARVWSRTPAHVSQFVLEMESRSAVPLRACKSAREAVDEATIVALVTTSHDPVVENGWIAGGAHICAVGACRPNQREMDPALVARGRLFVDSRTAALAEAGDIVIPMNDGLFGPDHIAGELGEVISGRVNGRQKAEDLTIFKSLGLAVEDVAAARLAYRQATEHGLGREFLL